MSNRPEGRWQRVSFADLPGPVRDHYNAHHVESSGVRSDRQDVITIKLIQSRDLHLWHQSADGQWKLVPEIPPWIEQTPEATENA
jgi:hypothetical protein